jgi:molecular chaperone DnaK
MSASQCFLGIDLGTTNSAAAVFDGQNVTLVRNAAGETITPSVVRIDARGIVTVGSRARRYLDKDPDNVRTEFKRLLGAGHQLSFPASGATKRPEELSAAVLAAIRADVEAQLGFAPTRAVISVPALFELPQTAATSEAARLAGFAQVDMIQEPVASALAAGWRDTDPTLPWLIYDLGGGTFDVSLLETREGLLRVIGHDGDNFLGGRDFDDAIVDWATDALRARGGPALERANPEHRRALRRLRAAAEEAKIELTRARAAELALPDLEVDGREVELELVLDRSTLERLVAPLVQRTIAVCQRLLATHGIVPGPEALARVVLVGGPTAMPFLRERVAAALAAPFTQGHDPMTLVAQGAAYYAGTIGLDAAAPATPGAAAAGGGVRVWLQSPAVSADVNPFVVGKLVDRADLGRVRHVVLRETQSGWTGEPEALDADGSFVAMVSLTPRRTNTFALTGRDANGRDVALDPPTLTIVHGTTIGDPPLSRTVGVALASDRVQAFFERGAPLPTKRTFVLRTAETLSPQDPDGVLRVPIVQGEFAQAHLCRLVGSLDVRASALGAVLPAQSPVELTLEVDRGGRLGASARVVATGQVFDQVAHLVAGTLDAAAAEARLDALGAALAETRTKAFRFQMTATIARLGDAEAQLAGARRDASAARGGDLDALERLRRALVDLDVVLAEAEADLAWPELTTKAERVVAFATSWVAEFGTSDERTTLHATRQALEKARVAQNAVEVQRQIDLVRRLGAAAALRRPDAWREEFDYVAGRAVEATDPRKAARLVEEGHKAASAGQEAELERIVRDLWKLLPHSAEDRRLAHGSGVT